MVLSSSRSDLTTRRARRGEVLFLPSKYHDEEGQSLLARQGVVLAGQEEYSDEKWPTRSQITTRRREYHLYASEKGSSLVIPGGGYYS
jgi:hypothetical protein